MADYELKLDTQTWEQVLRVLTEVPKNVTNSIVRGAAKKALEPILGVARAILGARSGTTGLLASSLGIVQKSSARRGTVYSIVGPRTGFKDPVTGENPVNIAHLVEDGTKPHLISPKGMAGVLEIKRGVGPTVFVKGAIHHPGAVAKPFMRPAYDARGRQAVAIMEREMAAGIMRRVQRFERSVA